MFENFSRIDLRGLVVAQEEEWCPGCREYVRGGARQGAHPCPGGAQSTDPADSLVAPPSARASAYRAFDKAAAAPMRVHFLTLHFLSTAEKGMIKSQIKTGIEENEYQ